MKKKLNETETFYDPFLEKEVTRKTDVVSLMGHEYHSRFDVYFQVTDIIEPEVEPVAVGQRR